MDWSGVVVYGSAVEEYEMNGTWISVEDELPRVKPFESKPVIITDGKYVDIGAYMDYGFEKGWTYSMILEGPVTHWMPIPTLPAKIWSNGVRALEEGDLDDSST